MDLVAFFEAGVDDLGFLVANVLEHVKNNELLLLLLVAAFNLCTSSDPSILSFFSPLGFWRLSASEDEESTSIHYLFFNSTFLQNMY